MSRSTLAGRTLTIAPGSPAHLLRDAVYETLKRAIVDGTLPPDERLRDQDIAQRLEVSRMPVREALRRLADEGLVVAEASRWTKVAPLDFGAAVRVYPIISALECLALSLVDAWPEGRLGAMRAANEDLQRALASDDPVAAATADDSFHAVILDAAANPELGSVVVDMKTRVRRLEIAYFGGSVTATESCGQHAAIVDALERQDLGAATASLQRNWAGSLERALSRAEVGAAGDQPGAPATAERRA